jgi:hypothetical protein
LARALTNRRRGEHASVLRAPAWDAHLKDVDGTAFRVFEANRQHRGGFLLRVQAGGREFMTVVDDAEERVIVGSIVPRSAPTLPMAL